MTPETNLTEDRAQTKAFVEFSVLSFYGWWITTTINLFLSCSLHSPLHHNISWEFSYPCCPSQGICPPCAVQTLVSLSGNNWSVGWSCCPASQCCIFDVCGSRTLEPLSIRKGRSLHNRLCIIFSVFDDDDGHKRGQTSRPVVGAEIQTNCNFETHMSHCSYLLGYLNFSGLWYISNYRITLWLGRVSTLSTLLLLLISIISYTKIFRTLSRHQAEVQHHVQQQPSQPYALNMVKYRKALYSALWVQIALVVCYLPFVIMEIFISPSRIYPSHLVVYWEIAVGLVQFNSTLNPFIYCWKISEVRQAVKQTMRQALCCL